MLKKSKAKKNILRVGVIGLGNMGRHHIRHYRQIPNAKLVAICDPRTDLLQTYAEDACAGYTDLDEMLVKEQLDAVSIAAPSSLHFEIAQKVIEKDISVLIEKPITDDIEKADALIEQATQRGVTLMVGHIERFNPAILKLKELLDSGKLGQVISIIANRVGKFPGQIKDANVIIDLAVHDIDIINYLLGKQPDDIKVNASRNLIKCREDHAEIFLTYGKQSGFIQVNWVTPISKRSLTLTATKGYVELDYMKQELTLYESKYDLVADEAGTEVIKFTDTEPQNIQLEKHDMLNFELTHFLDCVRNKKTPLVTGEYARNSLAIALKAIKHIS